MEMFGLPLEITGLVVTWWNVKLPFTGLQGPVTASTQILKLWRSLHRLQTDMDQ